MEAALPPTTLSARINSRESKEMAKQLLSQGKPRGQWRVRYSPTNAHIENSFSDPQLRSSCATLQAIEKPDYGEDNKTKGVKGSPERTRPSIDPRLRIKSGIETLRRSPRIKDILSKAKAAAVLSISLSFFKVLSASSKWNLPHSPGLPWALSFQNEIHSVVSDRVKRYPSHFAVPDCPSKWCIVCKQNNTLKRCVPKTCTY